MKDAKGNYIYEIIRGAIDAFDECMNDYLFVYAVREDLYYISRCVRRTCKICISRRFTDADE